MQPEASPQNLVSLKLGYWSALLMAMLFVLWIICFAGIIEVNGIYSWIDLQDYVAYTKGHSGFFRNIAQAAMILFAPLFLILLVCIHEQIPADKKIFSRLSLYFGIIFATLTSAHYFIQLSTVRLNILNGQTSGLEQFLQANPLSASSAINMLGWSLFLGLSSVFLSFLFSGNRLEQIIGYAFWANGLFCLLGGLGYILDKAGLVFLCMNIGMGGAVLVATITLAIWFRRKALDSAG